MKTCEEYVLKELEETKDKLLIAETKIKELETSKEETAEDVKDMQCIYLSDKPYYFYSVSTQSTWNWNKILKKNNKTPKFVEEALTDEDKFKELCSLKEDSYYNGIGKVNQNVYNYLLKTRNGEYAITLSSDSAYMQELDKKGYHNFSKEEEAIKKYGCTRLSHYIYLLRNEDYNIISDYKKIKTRYGEPATIAVYTLKEEK